jgi:hypothetical protein
MRAPSIFQAMFAAALAACVGCATARPPDLETAVARVAQRTGRATLTVGPIAANLSMFRMVTARGTSRDLGRALGLIAIERGYPFPAVSPELRGRNQSIIAFYREIYPTYLERMAGVAEAWGKALEDLDLTLMEAAFFVRTAWARGVYDSP